ncbi:MAG: Lrp/AsnC family transcriptional regulator [Pseudomonadales bacterium]
MKLDDKDKRLLALLQRDARTSTAQLAREVHLARSSVQARIARLEQRGVITGYHAALDQALLPSAVRARVAVTASGAEQGELIAQLCELPCVNCCESVSGESDILLEICTASTEALEQVVDHINRLPGVERTQSSIVLKRYC